MTVRRILAAGFVLCAAGSVAKATDVTSALTFVGIAPCRIIDTRVSSGFSDQYGPPAMVAGAVRTFTITGATTGTPSQCGIPDNALAISANFTATGITGAGDFRAFPAGGSLPTTSILNYKLETLANAVIVPMGDAGSGHKGISVRCDVKSADMVVDVNGYYVPRPVTITLTDDQGSTNSTTPVVISSIYSADFRSQGHVEARIVARFNNNSQTPACSGGGTGTIQLVQGATVLASVSRTCGTRAWLEYSAPFTLPGGPAGLDLKAFNDIGGTMTWRSVELELTK
jgi:hypothetical protein